MVESMLDRDQIAPLQIRPLRRVEYDRLVDDGLLGEDDRVELLRGMLVTMSPQKSPHAGVVSRLDRMLTRAFGDRADVRCQSPFAATDDSEPEPDIAVVPVADYDDAHPAWAHLIIEVAWDSLRKDRLVKPGIYAEARVPEYWLVDLVGDAIEVFNRPVRGRYAGHRKVRRGGKVRAREFPDLQLAVDEILPAPGLAARIYGARAKKRR
jgi:Uma2 family endonuclease